MDVCSKLLKLSKGRGGCQLEAACDVCLLTCGTERLKLSADLACTASENTLLGMRGDRLSTSRSGEDCSVIA